LNGVDGAGDYTAQIVVPSRDTETSTDPVSVLISRSDVNATVNFSLIVSGSDSGHGSDSLWTDPFDPAPDPIFHPGPGRRG
jgi:hypothetical protein